MKRKKRERNNQEMTKKAWIVIGAALAAVAVAAGCAALTGSKQETYRSIMVYQVNGSAEITRERVGEMEAYENLMLLSGDVVEVDKESNMRLKLDDDKYLLAEQDTVMNIKADGDGDNAKTYIDLQRGSVTSEIQNKLEKGASYEVNTPNSVMAVRGTIFRVALEQAEDGELETRLSVFDGTVGVKQVLPDGTVLDTDIAVEAGKELKINESQFSDAQANTIDDIDYESLPPVMKEYLEELAQKGEELPENVIQGIQNMRNTQDAQEQNEQKANEDNALDTVQGGQDIEQKNEEKEMPEKPDAQKKLDAPKKPKKEEQKPAEVQTQQIKPEEQETKEKDKEEEKAKEKETKPKQEVTQQSFGTEKENKPSGGGGAKTRYYTVTFKYNGSVFGTQRVKKGEKAAEPKLSPAQNGGWDYGFSKKINKNIAVGWKEKEAKPQAYVDSATNGTDNITYYYKERGVGDNAYTTTVPKPSEPESSEPESSEPETSEPESSEPESSEPEKDTTPPVIDGVADGGIYYGEQTVRVTDENLSSVSVNAIPASISGNTAEIKLAPSEDSIKIVAEDKAGNQTAYTVEVLETWVRDGITADGKKKLKQARAYKLGEGQWSVDGDATVYQGNMAFYVNKGGEYNFNYIKNIKKK